LPAFLQVPAYRAGCLVELRSGAMDVVWLLAMLALFGSTAGLAVGCGRLPGAAP